MPATAGAGAEGGAAKLALEGGAGGEAGAGAEGGAGGAGGEAGAGGEPNPNADLEVEGVWNDNYGGWTVIDSHVWGSQEIHEFNNEELIVTQMRPMLPSTLDNSTMSSGPMSRMAAGGPVRSLLALKPSTTRSQPRIRAMQPTQARGAVVILHGPR